MAKAQEDRVEARMALAREKLKVARVLIESGHYSDAVSKAYYAMFYASKALLLALGEDPHKHQGVVSMFGKKIAKVGLTHPRYGRTLAIAQQLREEADYSDDYKATREDSEDAIRNAEDFVNEAQTILRKIQTRGK